MLCSHAKTPPRHGTIFLVLLQSTRSHGFFEVVNPLMGGTYAAFCRKVRGGDNFKKSDFIICPLLSEHWPDPLLARELWSEHWPDSVRVSHGFFGWYRKHLTLSGRRATFACAGKGLLRYQLPWGLKPTSSPIRHIIHDYIFTRSSSLVV
eukprot:sb/3473548/